MIYLVLWLFGAAFAVTGAPAVGAKAWGLRGIVFETWALVFATAFMVASGLYVGLKAWGIV